LPFLNLCTGNPPDVTGIVHCLAIFVGAQVSLQVNGLAANHAGYFREGSAVHKTPLFLEDQEQLNLKAKCGLSSFDPFGESAGAASQETTSVLFAGGRVRCRTFRGYSSVMPETRSERGTCRFVAAEGQDGKPVIRVELFHKTVSVPTHATLNFNLLRACRWGRRRKWRRP
jgi:hypothetical protein